MNKKKKQMVSTMRQKVMRLARVSTFIEGLFEVPRGAVGSAEWIFFSK